MSPEERSLRARLAAHALHARVRDPSAYTQPARDKFLERFEHEADPSGSLPEEERKRRALHARKAYMLKLALKSAQVRRGRKAKAS